MFYQLIYIDITLQNSGRQYNKIQTFALHLKILKHKENVFLTSKLILSDIT